VVAVVTVAAAAAAAVAGRGASARRRNPRRSLDQSCRAGVSGRPDVGTACAGEAGKGGRAGGEVRTPPPPSAPASPAGPGPLADESAPADARKGGAGVRPIANRCDATPRDSSREISAVTGPPLLLVDTPEPVTSQRFRLTSSTPDGPATARRVERINRGARLLGTSWYVVQRTPGARH
jgi:hypothetical protein